MKHCLVIIAAAAATSLLAAPAPRAASAISANASLRDGSAIRGEFRTERIHGSTAFLDKLDLDPGIIKSVTFDGTNGESKVELANGDKFAMTIANESFAIKSLLGDLDIPRANFRSLALSARNLAAGGTEDGLVFYCTFDDEEAIAKPVVGPKGTVCSRDFVEGKVGRAVHVPIGGSAGFFNLPPETFGKEGCIEFWAKIESKRETFRDCDPRMIFIRSPAGWFTVEYSSNNGEGLGGFNVRCFGINSVAGGSFGMRYRYSDIIEDVTEWHHYAFSWADNSLTTYIDGEKFPMRRYSGSGIDEAKLKSGSASMGLPNNNTEPHNTEPNSAFCMDELKIWNFAKEDFAL